jgi:hypothetical protein
MVKEVRRGAVFFLFNLSHKCVLCSCVWIRKCIKWQPLFSSNMRILRLKVVFSAVMVKFRLLPPTNGVNGYARNEF